MKHFNIKQDALNHGRIDYGIEWKYIICLVFFTIFFLQFRKSNSVIYGHCFQVSFDPFLALALLTYNQGVFDYDWSDLSPTV